MMKHYLITVLTLLSATLYGQNETSTQLSLEIDPAPYILSGYSVSLKYSPKKTPKVAYMASIYQSDFPDKMMSKTNRENGWTTLKLETSFAAFAEFYLMKERKGLYIGPSLFWYNKSVEFTATKERIKFSSVYPNARIGYVWYPFKKVNLYLNPWLNIGSEIALGQNNQLNGEIFEPNKFNYIAALHLGYSFGRK